MYVSVRQQELHSSHDEARQVQPSQVEDRDEQRLRMDAQVA